MAKLKLRASGSKLGLLDAVAGIRDRTLDQVRLFGERQREVSRVRTGQRAGGLGTYRLGGVRVVHSEVDLQIRGASRDHGST